VCIYIYIHIYIYIYWLCCKGSRTFLLLHDQLLLSRDVAAVALGENVLTHCLHLKTYMHRHRSKGRGHGALCATQHLGLVGEPGGSGREACVRGAMHNRASHRCKTDQHVVPSSSRYAYAYTHAYLPSYLHK